MIGTVSQWLARMSSERDSVLLRSVVAPIADRLSTHCITSAGLVIKAAASPLVKAGTACYAIAGGSLVKIAANTDMAALSGTVTNGKFNVFAFFVDAAGALTSIMGTEGATLAQVKLPPPPVNKACLGLVVINPTGTGPFVGGTTALDNATVVPNADYINFTAPVDGSVLL